PARTSTVQVRSVVNDGGVGSGPVRSGATGSSAQPAAISAPTSSAVRRTPIQSRRFLAVDPRRLRSVSHARARARFAVSRAMIPPPGELERADHGARPGRGTVTGSAEFWHQANYARR